MGVAIVTSHSGVVRDESALRLLVLCAATVKGHSLDAGVLARQAQRPGGVDALYDGTIDELSDAAVMTQIRLREALMDLENARQRVEHELAVAEHHGAYVVTAVDPAYPATLRMIHDRPPFLVVRGAITDDDLRSIAVVGTREPTEAGLRRAMRLAKELVENDVTVVSGLALGIDQAAHRAAMHAGGRTIAVLGHGISRLSPPQHVELAEQIVRSGALVSHFWPTQAPTRATFLARNAVCSGLAQGTAVIEASFRSGAKAQARIALEQGKHVFLLRSLVDAELWAHAYCKYRGAHVVNSVDDVVEHLLARDQVRAMAQREGAVGHARRHLLDARSSPTTWSRTAGERARTT